MRDVVGRTHQVQRAAHQRAAHDRPVVQCPVQIFATEPVQAGPETGERRSRFLGLHTAEPLHRLDGGAAFSPQQHLPRQRGPVEPSPGQQIVRRAHGAAQASFPQAPGRPVTAHDWCPDDGSSSSGREGDDSVRRAVGARRPATLHRLSPQSRCRRSRCPPRYRRAASSRSLAFPRRWVSLPSGSSDRSRRMRAHRWPLAATVLCSATMIASPLASPAGRISEWRFLNSALRRYQYPGPTEIRPREMTGCQQAEEPSR